MDTATTLAIATGITLRLAIPIILTGIAIFILRRLDNHWQAEAEEQLQLPVVEKVNCWEIKNCAPETRASCAGYQSEQPCWQAFRSNAGYLRDSCLECEVFKEAPVPTQTKEVPAHAHI